MNETAKLLAELMQEAVVTSTSTRSDVFIGYAPHVNSLTINIYVDGWRSNRKNNPQYYVLNISEDQRKIQELIKYIKHLGGNNDGV